MAKSKFGSIISMTCPRCRNGKLFEQPYSWTTAYKMPQACKDCGQKFEPEPGFYYGAMFISYIITAWIFVAVGLALTFGLGWTVSQTLIAVAFLTVLIHNFIFRFSRSLWIHIFVKHEPRLS